MLLIEAKFRSGKSSFAIDPLAEEAMPHKANDQLAREWQNLRAIDVEGWLIYLTTDYCIPHGEIDESQRDLQGTAGRICWLSWRDLLQVTAPAVEEPLFRDVKALLGRLDLIPFLGVNVPAAPVISWRFRERSWIWSTTPPTGIAPLWRFSVADKPWFSSPVAAFQASPWGFAP